MGGFEIKAAAELTQNSESVPGVNVVVDDNLAKAVDGRSHVDDLASPTSGALELYHRDRDLLLSNQFANMGAAKKHSRAIVSEYFNIYIPIIESISVIVMPVRLNIASLSKISGRFAFFMACQSV